MKDSGLPTTTPGWPWRQIFPGARLPNDIGPRRARDPTCAPPVARDDGRPTTQHEMDAGRSRRPARLPGKARNTPFDSRALEGVVPGIWKAGWRVFD